jgi:hypothetical protein
VVVIHIVQYQLVIIFKSSLLLLFCDYGTQNTALTVMMVKWKTFLLMSPAVTFACVKQKLQTEI